MRTVILSDQERDLISIGADDFLEDPEVRRYLNPWRLAGLVICVACALVVVLFGIWLFVAIAAPIGQAVS